MPASDAQISCDDNNHESSATNSGSGGYELTQRFRPAHTETYFVRGHVRGRLRGGRGRGRGQNSARGRTHGGRGVRRGRGRGRGTGRGLRPLTTVQSQDASKGWTIAPDVCSNVVMEQEFAQKVIGERARLFCSAAVSKMVTECRIRSLSPTRCGFVVLFMSSAIQQCTEWLNELVQLRGLSDTGITDADMYRYVSVLLLSHCSGFSFEKATTLLTQAGCVTPSLELIRFISSNILAYSPTGRGSEGTLLWNAQRDQTRQLSEFEISVSGNEEGIFFTTASSGNIR